MIPGVVPCYGYGITKTNLQNADLPSSLITLGKLTTLRNPNLPRMNKSRECASTKDLVNTTSSPYVKV